MFKRQVILIIMFLGILLAACSGVETPQMIASYPEEPIAIYPKSQDIVIIYHAYIEMEVGSVDQTAERASKLVYDYGGYLISSQSWHHEGRKFTTLQLAVPPTSFDDLRRSLLRLGDLVSEQVSGDLVATGYPPEYSQITIQLRPKPSNWPSLPALNLPGWNPAHTFNRAFSVFVSIFGFMADILIWVVVVIGPFVVMGWALWVLAKRMRGKVTHQISDPEDEG